MKRAVLAAGAVVAACAAAAGQVEWEDDDVDWGLERPRGAGRLVTSWDFEDRERTGEPVPAYWFRSLHDPENGSFREGFPRYNLAALDDSRSYEGRWSVRLPTNGGSTSLVLAAGVVPTMPDGDVLVTAMVRTEGLERARARVVARFLDDGLAPVPGERFVSEPLITGGSWRAVSLEMRGSEASAWIQLELQVLQPAQLQPAEGDGYRVYREDVSGAAWFDDLRVYQIPRVTLSSQSAFNVVSAPARPVLELRVQDLTGEVLSAELTAYGIDGTLVDGATREVRADGRAVVWEPRLEGYGWYRCSARISNSEGVVGQAVSDVAWLSPAGVVDDASRRRFGIVVPDEEGEDLSMLPAMAEALGTGSMWLEVWGRLEREEGEAGLDGALERDPWSAIGAVVERLLEGEQELTFVLDRAPREAAIRAHADPERPLAVMRDPESGWLESLGPLITRYGERVRRWQVGAVGSEAAFFEEDVAAVAAGIHESLFRLIPRPILVLGWGMAQSAAAIEGVVEGMMVWTPSTVPAESIGVYASAWPSDMEVSLALALPSLESYGVEGRIRELARRGVSAWSASGVESVAIEKPWVWRHERDGGPMPTGEFVVWRTLAEALSGREFAGELWLGEGMRVLIAERREGASAGDDGVLVAWNERGREGAAIEAHLGHGRVRVRDVFGNVRPVEPVDGVHRIELGATPVFIEGVDGRLLRFRAALRLEPGFLETRAARQDAMLHVENPWGSPIECVLRIGGEEGWEVTPRVVRFSLGAGERASKPVSVTFGLNEEAGAHDVGMEVALQADRRYPVLEMPLRVELGLESIDVSASYQLVGGSGPGDRDVVVTVVVTNSGAEEASYEALVIAPGFAGREAPVTKLGPGEASVRRFVFEGGQAALSGSRVRVALREINGTGRLNTWLEIK